MPTVAEVVAALKKKQAATTPPVNPMDTASGPPADPNARNVVRDTALHGLTEALGYTNMMGTVGGAALLDLAEGRHPWGDIPSHVPGQFTPLPKGSAARKAATLDPKNRLAVGHALDLFGQGQSLEAADQYFPTSPAAIKRFAAAGNPIAKIIHDHPRLLGVAADWIGRGLDPGNALTGETTGLLGATARAGVRGIGRTAARGVSWWDPAARYGPAAQVGRSLEHQVGARRFAEQRAAAEDIARKKGLKGQAVVRAGDRAEQAAMNGAVAQEQGRTVASQVAKRILGGLSKADQIELYRLQEGTSRLLGKNLSPADKKLLAELQPRVNDWRKYIAGLDVKTRKWMGAEGRLLSPGRFLPRKGAFIGDAEHDYSPGVEEWIEGSRSRGGATARVGTASQKIHRKYATFDEALAQGSATGKFSLDPNWNPMETLENFLAPRETAHRLHSTFEQFQDLGLIQSKWKVKPIVKKIFKPLKPPLPGEGEAVAGGDPALRATIAKDLRKSKAPPALNLLPRPPGASPLGEAEMNMLARGVMKPNLKAINRTVVKGIQRPLPEGMAPMTELGDIRTFGLPLTREAYGTKAAHNFINEIQPAAANKGNASLLFQAPSAALKKINKLAASVQVAFAPYHALVNLRPNVGAALQGPGEWIRGLHGFFDPKAIEEARATGAAREWAPHRAAHETNLPWSDLTAQQRRDRFFSAVPRAWERVSAEPLYKHLEPRVAAMIQRGTEKRLGKAGSMLEARSALGEPENISSAMRPVAQAFEFPGWFLSQMARWTGKMATRPTTFTRPHAAIEDWNESMGRGMKSGDMSRFLPPIMLGTAPGFHDPQLNKTYEGDRIVFELPHPGDRPMRFGNAVAGLLNGKGNMFDVGSAIAGGANPAMSSSLHAGLSAWQQSYRASDWAHDLAAAKPPQTGNPVVNSIRDWASSFSAYSPIPGIGSQGYFHKELAPERSSLRRKIIGQYLYPQRKLERADPDFAFGILEMRQKAESLRAKGDEAGYNRITARANKFYKRLTDALVRHGFDPDPQAGDSGQASLPEALHALTNTIQRKGP